MNFEENLKEKCGEAGLALALYNLKRFEPKLYACIIQASGVVETCIECKRVIENIYKPYCSPSCERINEKKKRK